MIVKNLDQDLEDFLTSLDRNTYAKVLRHIDLLSVFGSKLRMPYSKPMDNGLFELRTRGRREVRIFYVFYHNEVILLHGFIKKTQKTPVKELKTALGKLGMLTII